MLFYCKFKEMCISWNFHSMMILIEHLSIISLNQRISVSIQHTPVSLNETFTKQSQSLRSSLGLALHKHEMSSFLCGHQTLNYSRYTLLLPGRTPLCLQKCLISLQNGFNKVLETFLKEFHSYWYEWMTQLCTLMMWISGYILTQRCSIGSSCSDYGGYLSTVSSLWCSRNQLEMIWAFWHGTLSCWRQPSKDGTLSSQSDGHGQQQH